MIPTKTTSAAQRTSRRGTRAPRRRKATAIAATPTVSTVASSERAKTRRTTTRTTSGAERRSAWPLRAGSARPSSTSARRSEADAPVPSPSAAARTKSAAQTRQSSSRGKRETIRFVMFRSMTSQRASKKTNCAARKIAKPSRSAKTRVRSVLNQLEKRFSRTHSAGVRRRSGGRSGSGVGIGSSASTRIAIAR
jgi:hypothetical protein